MAINVLSASRARLRAPFAPFRRARERAVADSWLVQHRRAFTTNPVVLDRIAELTSERERTRLAGSLRGAVRDAEHVGISASPLYGRGSSRNLRDCVDVTRAALEDA